MPNLRETPDFANNPALMHVDLSGCSKLTVTPDFSNNPELTEADLGWTGIVAAPKLPDKPDHPTLRMLRCRLAEEVITELKQLLGDRFIFR